MSEHIASTVIVIPDWALYAAFSMWTISILLSLAELALKRKP